jgi:hypothetical protein
MDWRGYVIRIGLLLWAGFLPLLMLCEDGWRSPYPPPLLRALSMPSFPLPIPHAPPLLYTPQPSAGISWGSPWGIPWVGKCMFAVTHPLGPGVLGDTTPSAPSPYHPRTLVL